MLRRQVELTTERTPTIAKVALPSVFFAATPGRGRLARGFSRDCVAKGTLHLSRFGGAGRTSGKFRFVPLPHALRAAVRGPFHSGATIPMFSLRKTQFGLATAFSLSLFTNLNAQEPRAAKQEQQAVDSSVRKVDIGGRNLTLRTRGKGGPTVVIEAGGVARLACIQLRQGPQVSDGEFCTAGQSVITCNQSDGKCCCAKKCPHEFPFLL